MQNEPKILKQRKQSLNKYQEYQPALLSSNTVNSITREKDVMSSGKVRSTSQLPKNYSNGLGGEIFVERNTMGSGIGLPKEKGEPPKGYFMVGWGSLPVRSGSIDGEDSRNRLSASQPLKISENVMKYCLGERHIVYINQKYEAYGLGSSIFGQLGYFQPPQQIEPSHLGHGEDCQYSSMPIPLLQQLLVEEVFCTPFCTFLITNRHQVYGCGLNNRGQLGVDQQEEEPVERSVSTPMKIPALSKKPLLLTEASENKPTLTNSKKKLGKIQSYALAEKTLQTNLQQPKLLTQKSECPSEIYLNTGNLQTQTYISDEFPAREQSESILDENEFIVDLVGGPYHTLALSNKGRAFYSGNIYKKSSVLNNQFTSKFAELNLKKIGKVRKIKSGISCIGLLNVQGCLFLLGAINENIICDEPYNVGINCIVDFAFTKDRIYVVTSLGEVWALVASKKSLKTYKVIPGGKTESGGSKVVSVDSGLDYCVFMNQKGEIYGSGSPCSQMFPIVQPNTSKQSRPASSKGSSEILDQPSFKLSCNLKLASIKAGNGFAVGLCSKYTANEIKVNLGNLKDHLANEENNENLMIRINQLEKQNKLLKELVKDEGNQGKSQRNVSARKKEMASSTNFGSSQNQLCKKPSNCENTNSKFDLNINVSQKIVSKARKFDNSMEIPFEELQLGKQISEGGYGVIYKAVWRKTTVAVKIFKIDLNSENSVKDFVSECHAMEALRHPNIVMFLGACTKPPNFAIVLEYCEGGTLWSILQKSGELSWEMRRRLALDTAKGMNYLHERPTPILHRDLKSLNLLLDQNKRIKLADFGWTKGLQNYMTGKIGTYQWMAPEVVSSHQYTQKADVFSFAIILWEIASREAPYRNIPGVQVAQDVLNKDLRPTVPKRTPEPFATLMKRCWVKSPESRPSFSQIIDELQKMELPA